MNEVAAKKLITDSLNAAYSETNFRNLVSNLLKNATQRDERPQSGAYIYEAFRNHIASLHRIAKYTDPDERIIDVLAVKLKGESKLEYARTMQRNFVAKYLDGGRGDQREAALVAFYSDDSPDWRFSLVKMDYRLDLDTGKTSKELTPARRYSFLVGEGERTHTAQQQLLPLLTSNSAPTLEGLERSFNIESVTKDFFNKYKELFLKLKEEIETLVSQDKTIKQDFESKTISSTTFAKRLLGQVVFLYFLQKKGWLGVKRGENWGTGPKDFLKQLFDKKYTAYDNFYNDILEPLFYEALANERTDNYYKHFNCKIPFLNGGLFEPLNNYDWVNTDLTLSNDTFADIFKTFDLYNFTVREDEPLEKEVAVDPEMLGKVFENLLEVQDRKSKGAFYTPREIVHYMCQESLINYLDTTLNTVQKPKPQTNQKVGLFETKTPEYEDVYEERVPRKDIETFIRLGEQAVENDARVASKGKETKDYSYILPQSIRQHAQNLDDALANIKICDPAIGSGAFPVGMMGEIVRSRLSLNAQLGTPNRTPYDFKRHAIQESIYGVDIEPSAVDIAKLRLWLSLVVDEDSFDNIKPLPNLDYKIVVGNSLLSLDGAIIDNREMTHLETLKANYFSVTSPSAKDKLREDINSSLAKIIESAKQFGSMVDFDIRLYFSEVFRRETASPEIYHVTWVTHNSRISERMVTFGVKQGEPILLTEQQEQDITRHISSIVIDDNKGLHTELHKGLQPLVDTLPATGTLPATRSRDSDPSVYGGLRESDTLPATRGRDPLLTPRQPYTVLAYAICQDHVHMVLVCLPQHRDNIVRKLKGKSTYLYKKQYGIEEPFNLWAQKYHHQIITTNEQLENTLMYVMRNRENHKLPENEGLQPLVQTMLTSYSDDLLRPVTIREPGFDIVIGNPPYVRQETLGPALKGHFKTHFETFQGTADLYVYFIERGVKLLKKGGTFCYIVANKWMRASYGKPLRQWLKKQGLNKLIDFGDLPVFEAATAYPCILFIQDRALPDMRQRHNEMYQYDLNELQPLVMPDMRRLDAGFEKVLQDKVHDDSFGVLQVDTLKFGDLARYVKEREQKLDPKRLDDNGWTLKGENVQSLLEKLKRNAVTLEKYADGKIYRGVLTGLNEAFVIDGETRQRLIEADPKSAEIIKPFLAGRDVKRYQPPKSDKYLILFPNGWTNKTSGDAKDKWKWLKQIYPAITRHLEFYESDAKKRYDQGEYWWEMRACD